MSSIQLAVQLLHQGKLVAFPTETVYGLGADAKNPEAIQKIFAAKERPADHPVIVHLADVAQLDQWAARISDDAKKLAQAFWPGPMTLVFKKLPQVSVLLTGGQETIGLRIPNHPVAHALLKAFGDGIAAPSANRFGRISPTTAEAVREELGERVDLILEGGACEVGVESTIIDVSGEQIAVLRPGMISIPQIEHVLQKKISFTNPHAIRLWGALRAHYAPQTPVTLVDRSEIAQCTQQPDAALLLCRGAVEQSLSYNVVLSDSPAQYAHDLYQTLRELDKKQFAHIYIEKVPQTPEWLAIQDRLQRAALAVVLDKRRPSL